MEQFRKLEFTERVMIREKALRRLTSEGKRELSMEDINKEILRIQEQYGSFQNFLDSELAAEYGVYYNHSDE